VPSPEPQKLTARLPARLRDVYAILDASYLHWRATRTLRLGAGIAYYALFAIVPLLSLAAALAARLISAETAREFLVDVLDGLVERSVEELAGSLLDEITRASSGLGLVGFILVAVSASFLFLALQDALNVIWEAPVRVGLRASLRRRMLAFGVALVVAAFFIGSFVVQSIVGLAERLIPGEVPAFDSLSRLITSAGTWALGVGTIALLFRYLPYAAVRWRDALVGGAITAVLIAIGTSLIGAYISRFGGTSITGAASSVVAFLGWVYYEAQIVLAGAVLTKVIGDRRRSEPA
jgi:membrane protein